MTDTQQPTPKTPETGPQSTETVAAEAVFETSNTSERLQAPQNTPSPGHNRQKDATSAAPESNPGAVQGNRTSAASDAQKTEGQKTGSPRSRRMPGTTRAAGKSAGNTAPSPQKKDMPVPGRTTAEAGKSSRSSASAKEVSKAASASPKDQTPEEAIKASPERPAPLTEAEKNLPPAFPASAPTDSSENRPSEKELPGAIPDSPAMREILDHGQRVATYTDILFRELVSLHGLSPEWGRRLHLAACLHDLGWLEGRKGHHKTSMRIIDEDLSLPIADDDRPWVALLARYHRKALPSRKHPRFALLKRSQQEMLRKAAALLRLADALDYSHKGIIQDLTVTIGKNKVILQAVCTGDGTEEIARCKEKGTLFVRMFKKEPKLVCLPQ